MSQSASLPEIFSCNTALSCSRHSVHLGECLHSLASHLFPEYTAPGNLIHLTAMTPAKSSETARPTYTENDYDCAGVSVALTFEYGLVNDFLSEWCEMKTKLNNGEISPNEYFEWKITWPQA